jgi:hypothetical protein
MATQTWDLWIPDAASRGVSFARGVMQPADEVIVHSAPAVLRVEVRDEHGGTVAFGDQLERQADSPMTRLRLRDGKVEREETWPTDADEGRPVILPGGEVGILEKWWNAADHSEWRWKVEFYNHR